MGSTTSVWGCGGNHFEPQIWNEDAIETNCSQNSIIHYLNSNTIYVIDDSGDIVYVSNMGNDGELTIGDNYNTYRTGDLEYGASYRYIYK